MSELPELDHECPQCGGNGIVTTAAWLKWEKRIAAAEKIPVDDKLHERVRRDFPPPRFIDFRMSLTKGK